MGGGGAATALVSVEATLTESGAGLCTTAAAVGSIAWVSVEAMLAESGTGPRAAAAAAGPMTWVSVVAALTASARDAAAAAAGGAVACVSVVAATLTTSKGYFRTVAVDGGPITTVGPKLTSDGVAEGTTTGALASFAGASVGAVELTSDGAIPEAPDPITTDSRSTCCSAVCLGQIASAPAVNPGSRFTILYHPAVFSLSGESDTPSALAYATSNHSGFLHSSMCFAWKYPERSHVTRRFARNWLPGSDPSTHLWKITWYMSGLSVFSNLFETPVFLSCVTMQSTRHAITSGMLAGYVPFRTFPVFLNVFFDTFMRIFATS
mmetsp:Transcript_4881/g.15342  ORF Transcript_4881/g.15342 Transcript_4881/m.15342 type:complete len:322 (+) Transcript_4881:238-1203(+)